jgi:hypothetical protein
MGDKGKSVKTTAEQEKTPADKLAFNNAAILALQQNAAERDATRKKNKEDNAALYARRRANRGSGSGTRLKGLSVLNDGFAGTSGVS